MVYKKDDIVTCENCKTRLEEVQSSLDLNPKEIFILKNPKKVVTTNFSVKMDNGETKLVSAYRVQYNEALGPTKGGIRFHQDVNMEEVSELAFLMSLKNSLAGLPYGGAKGGVRIDPKQLSQGEIERVARGYVRAMHEVLGEKKDIPAPDINTNSQVMAWMLDEYEKILGEKALGTITGKPLELGGSKGRDKSTARGGFFIIQEEYKNKDKPQINVAIQGFGNAGSNIAKMLYEEGYKVVAVSDSSSGLYDEKGLDVDKLIEERQRGNKFKDLKDYEKISNEGLLKLNVNLLIPSALGGVINEKNALEIKAKKILELANSPITPQAEKILLKNKISIVPDILANAGGVIVSYFEWVQNLQNYYWTEGKVDENLKEKIQTAYRKTLEESKNKKIDLRSASYSIGINRILKAERLRGRL